MGSNATGSDFAGQIRARFTDPVATLREQFTRIRVDLCIGYTDDHAHNPAASWDGADLSVTPPYDLRPQPRSGEATQAMAVVRDGARRSQFVVCLDAAEVYLLTRAQAADSVTPGTLHAFGVIQKESA